ncbi:MAG: AAA family ATPase, partial [Desulfovibrionaceae bacterium]|nr:AAA family ATPase [Desulfovibrionaceae bacterium]
MFKSTIGCSNFREIREKQLTYVDKTYFIEDFLAQGYAEVSLISGPKGFGKTLTLKMLAEFFDITKKSSDIFQGLKIADNEEICQQWMNQYPVIYFTFKDLTAKDHQSSLDIFADQIYELYKKHEYLSNSDEITSSFKSNLEKIFSNESSESDLIMSLYNLCKYLKDHWGKSPILLLDEYDVLFKIYSHQKENSDLLNFIQGLLGRVLKDNQYLKFAVITGSFGFEEKYIFSQANNISYSSIESGYYKDIFGFTESEVDDLLELAESTTKKSQITSWYGGYQFGKTTDIYCPWDVITYLDELMNKPDIYPKPYRVKNNEGIVKKFLDTNDLMINRAMETLLVQRSIKTNLMGHFTH